MKNVALYNLGCKVNSYEMEVMRQSLQERGYQIVPFDGTADIYIVNTCTVTNIADRKSRQILHRAKQLNPRGVVVAVGCYVQAGDRTARRDECIDLAIGNNRKKDIADLLEAFLEDRNRNSAVIDINGSCGYEETQLKSSMEHTRAYIKIQDGCNQFCSYCAIPYVRGRVRSRRPEVVVIDSIQTMYNESVSAAPGAVSQVRESTSVLLQLAKGLGVSILIVGHVTKEGTVAGPRVLEHMVDAVLYFEGDGHASYRILRGVKNRFGSTNEIGVFEMRESGLAEVPNASEYMLNGRPENASGSVVAATCEGTRPLLVEIQALVCHSNFGIPRRQTTGTDFNRVNLLMAVLEKRSGVQLAPCDAYVNITGGLKVLEPAMDLGIVIAILSSFHNRVLSPKLVAFGEVGLSGEVRGVSMAKQRVAEAEKLGFEICLLPAVCAEECGRGGGMKIIGVKTVQDVIDRLF